MSHCGGVVVGTLLEHRGEVAVADRQKPPRCTAPSAGHLEPDELVIGILASGDSLGSRSCALRELGEEAGYRADDEVLEFLFASRELDECAKTAPDGRPGGNHLWRVYRIVVPDDAARPKLRDEPGKMHGWRFRRPEDLVLDERLEPVWRDLLARAYGL